MKSRKYSTSSSSDDEALITLIAKDRNSYHSLLQKSLEQCEFCDEVFQNRYSLYEHNMKHMIIPLIFKSTHQCKECQHHFVSTEILNTHMLQHHNKIILKENNKSIKENIPEILRNLLEKQAVVQCDNNVNALVISKLSQNSKNNSNINSKITHGPIIENKMTNPGYGASQNDNETKSNSINAELEVKEEPFSPRYIKERVSPPRDDEKESIRHRLLFEEDIEDTLFKDISSECQVNIETLCQEVTFDFDDALEVSDSDEETCVEIKHETNDFSDEMNNSENEMNNSDNRTNNSVNEINNYENGMNNFSNEMTYCESDINNFEHETICSDNGISLDNKSGFKNGILNAEDGNNFENGINNSDNEMNNCENEMNNFKNGIGSIQINENGIHFEMLNESEKRKMQFKKAIHCDVLMKPDISVCKFCGKEFPNRFKLIQHELIHMQLKKRHWNSPLCCFCDRYIAGNYHTLRYHIAKKHPEKDQAFHTTHYCPKCGLKYHSYKKHVENYHEAYKCETCLARFETLEKKNEHTCGEENTVASSDTERNDESDANQYTVMQLCEFCISFLRIYMQNRQNYEEIGTKSELGMRQTCDQCKKECDTVLMVRRRALGRVRKADPNTSDFSHKTSGMGKKASCFCHKTSGVGKTPSSFSHTASDVGKTASSFSHKASDVGKTASGFGQKSSHGAKKSRMKSKPLSNVDRLMKIQNRLKMLRSINKF